MSQFWTIGDGCVTDGGAVRKVVRREIAPVADRGSRPGEVRGQPLCPSRSSCCQLDIRLQLTDLTTIMKDLLLAATIVR